MNHITLSSRVGWALVGLLLLLSACTPRPTPQIEANLREQTLTDAWIKLAEFVEVDPAQPVTHGWEMLIDEGEFRHLYLPFAAATGDGQWAHVNVFYLTEPQTVGNVSGYALQEAPDPANTVPVADLMAAIDQVGGVLALAPPGPGFRVVRTSVVPGDVSFRTTPQLKVFRVQGGTITPVADGASVQANNRVVTLSFLPAASPSGDAMTYLYWFQDLQSNDARRID